MATTQKRAAKNGEIGANGEFYAGGKFINTVAANAKKHGSRPAKACKVQIEPGVWVIDTRKPLFRVVGAGACYIDRYDVSKGIAPYAPAFNCGVMYQGTTIEEIQSICDRYNAGERWM